MLWPRNLPQCPWPLMDADDYVPANRMLAAAISPDCPYAPTLFYSLLNAVISYDPVGWGVPYAGAFTSDERESEWGWPCFFGRVAHKLCRSHSIEAWPICLCKFSWSCWTAMSGARQLRQLVMARQLSPTSTRSSSRRYHRSERFQCPIARHYASRWMQGRIRYAFCDVQQIAEQSP